MTTSANTSFTAFSTKDLIEKRGKLAVLTKDAVADTAPLRAKIAKIFDQEFIEAIAAEYRKGRILNIGTTNLDTGRPVTWSISRIAISGAPNALDLIHDVILASISIGLRSVSSLIRTQGIGDLDRIYLEAQRDGLDFHLAYIPDDFNAKSAQPFDPVYMKKLFDVGYNLAKNGYPWQLTPPGYGQQEPD